MQEIQDMLVSALDNNTDVIDEILLTILKYKEFEENITFQEMLEIERGILTNEQVDMVDLIRIYFKKELLQSEQLDLQDEVKVGKLLDLIDTLTFEEVLALNLGAETEEQVEAVDKVKAGIKKELLQQDEVEVGDEVKVSKLLDLIDTLTFEETISVLRYKENKTEELVSVQDFIKKEVKKVLKENIEILDEIKLGKLISLNETLTFNEFLGVWLQKQIDLTEQVAMDDIVVLHKFVVKEFDRLYILDDEQKKIAVLKEVWDIRIYEEIKGEYSISFKMKNDDVSAEYVRGSFYILCRGRLFFIIEYNQIRDEQNRTIIEVFGQHISFELQNFLISVPWAVDGFTREKPPALLELPYLFAYPNAEFKAKFGNFYDYHEVSNTYPNLPIYIHNKDCLTFISEVLKVYSQLEMKRDNYKIIIGDELYERMPIVFRYGRNIKGIRKKVDLRDLTYSYTGSSVWSRDLTWSMISIEGIKGYYRKKYLQSYRIDTPKPEGFKVSLQKVENIDDSKIENLTFNEAIVDGVLRNPEIDDYVLGSALTDLTNNSKPKISYEIDIAELWQTNKKYDFEKFNVGDFVRIIDDELSINDYFQIVSYEFYPFEPEKCKITLSNNPKRFVDLFRPSKLYASSYLERDDVIIFNEVISGQEESTLESYISQQIIETGKTEEEIREEVANKYKVYKHKVSELEATFIPVTT
jgi:hypothetical protein